MSDGLASGRYSAVLTAAGVLASRKLPSDLIAGADSRRDGEDGQLVWVRLSWLRSFVKEILPRVKSTFCSVTGACTFLLSPYGMGRTVTEHGEH
jgi:hypothetical protein